MFKTYNFVIVMALLVPLAAIAQTEEDMTEAADTANADEVAILGVLDSYVKAFHDADADLLESLVWLDDERFTEIEDMIPVPFGKKTFLAISEWTRANAKPGTREMTFHDPRVFFLADNVTYLIAIQEVKTPEGEGRSRVSLIFLKKNEEWKIIHGHFSELPKAEG
jgi:hypothetical protein